MFGDSGWEVLFLGTSSPIGEPLTFSEHARVQVKRLKFIPAGLIQKLHYGLFCIWVLFWVWKWRPAWIYASDPFSAPVAWFIRKLTKIRVLYHEHDSPSDGLQSGFIRLVLAFRSRLGREADLCVLPQMRRLAAFVEETKRIGPSYCVWNCARRDEIVDGRSDTDPGLIVYYQGSINEARLPRELIIAASRFKGQVIIRVAGYETVGSVGYMDELNDLATRQGAREIIEFMGAISPRKELLPSVAKGHVGLSLMPRKNGDRNLVDMVGASNKAFDCMAAGLPLLVSDLPDWIATFVDPGYARACNPEEPNSIEAELRWYLEHPVQRAEMGRICRNKIRQDWNYETAFSPVMSFIETAQ